MRNTLYPIAGLSLLMLVAGAASSGAVATGACVPGDPALAGRYDLKQVMNVGSRLTLKKDGTFDYRLSYGAVSQRGKGCWTREGDNITLMPSGATKISTTPVLDRTEFAGLTLHVDGEALTWDIAGDGRVGRYEKR